MKIIHRRDSMQKLTKEDVEDMNRLEAKRIIRGLNKYEKAHLKALNRRYATTIPDDNKRREYLEIVERG